MEERLFLALGDGLLIEHVIEESRHFVVLAALTMTYSNEVVEGHAHRLKLIKRQGYGRASFPFLRKRALASHEKRRPASDYILISQGHERRCAAC